MSGKYAFDLQSEERRRSFPGKIIVGRKETETEKQVLLKFLAYILFFRDRIQMEPRLHDDNIPFEPDVVVFDYSLRPTLWVECGECGAAKLDKLAVKIPEAEIWVVRRSLDEAESLRQAMAKAELRRDRYGLIAVDHEMFDEMAGMLSQRNQLSWITGGFDPPMMQFEFNGLWFDSSFHILRF